QCPRARTLLLRSVLPTQTSTPSPYTTLFRSLFVPGRRGVQARSALVHRALSQARPHRPVGRHARRPRLGPFHQSSHRFVAQTETDRKSTRLNSSHQIISYAVFCLKKKTQT